MFLQNSAHPFRCLFSGEANIRHGAEPPAARVAAQQHPRRAQGQVQLGADGLGGGRPLRDVE